MSQAIQRAAVIGAGTMGAGIAAHLANAGVPTLLLDIPAEGADRNAIVRGGLERCLKAKPAALMDPERRELITLGNTADDLAQIGRADWVVEVIVEKLEPKQELLARLEPLVRPDGIVSSNSSGIPMKLQVKGRSEPFRRNFLGTHFFNPPRYLHLLELIPNPDTDPSVLERMRRFGESILGKGIVVAKDVPGFAANRVGLYCVARSMRAMLELGLTPDVVDVLTGPLIGRPKSATFRTADLSGVDIVYQVSQNLANATGEEGLRLPPQVGKLVENRWLGDKTGHGFYKKVSSNGKSVILTLNLDTFEYEDRGRVELEELKPIVKLASPEERIAALLESSGTAGEFTRRTIFHQIHYAASKVGEVAENAAEVDNALKWGFNWQVGPLELAGALGRDRCIRAFEEHDLPVPASLDEPLSQPRGWLVLKTLKQERRRVVRSNPDASILDMGEGVALLEFHGKANAIGQQVLEMFEQAHAVVPQNFLGLVIGNQGQNFCAGADLGMMLRLVESGDFEALRAAVKAFQGMTSRLRYCPFPVVSAPFGLNLGGGCEVALWSDAVVAGAELYTGLVEIGVGILPAGGGTTEMLIRMNEHLLPGSEPFAAVSRAFELIGQAKVSGSALQARSLGFLRPSDVIGMNPDRLLIDARQRVLALAPGYVPPPRRKVPVLGEAAYANLCTYAYGMMEGGFITPYEYELARTVARVLSGGTMNRTEVVDEELLLELEAEAFLHLAGQEKTRDRIAYTLKTGKTLRN
ncbi:MAG: 3-hydroxyacyl-CoA dehydrogenase/enoyl-CoA hydratase family protein [Armatimonadetes bacterium]|nr:3-hydroxyacyl-CoA dehydrogenase/enoyl-CoA hydratase family protein [Armatimonadota bacterium]